MQYAILSFLLCFSFFEAFAQNDCFELSINQTHIDKSILTLDLENMGDTILEIQDFQSNRNSIIITNDKDEEVFFNFIHCGFDFKTQKIEPTKSHSWIYDIDDFFKNATRNLPEGTYNVYWLVHGVESEAFEYRH